ncbi:putative NBD/HSP70 family sugar kinase [Agromyces terreus]|uniref:NBD/HSP70 family sugar kinase n=1 Tax=Agromyces terreus TaxID=424795 RepID=A0A9X2H354_9MICO|nr:ROK family protein [Agromyces terreus]MCP2371840.1 putative NBD/HSP70 family sugar kinase [Agromyces terreus]
MNSTATPRAAAVPVPAAASVDGRSTSSSDGDAFVATALDGAALAAMVELVRSGASSTRPELVSRSGLGRKIVTQRVDQAIELGLIVEGELAPSAGGRQARTLRFRAEAGRVLVAQIGASEFSAGLADLDGNLTEVSHEDWDIAAGPESTMARIHDHFETLSRRARLDRPWAIGIGLPGPVDFSTARLVAPPIMPGWDGFSARGWLREHYDAPVWVDNDVNLMAIGEWTKSPLRDERDLLFVKIGTGVGAGMIVRGRLVRGQSGAAGDIGHTHVTDDPTKVCRCGKVGCLEAVASGWSMLLEATARAAESPLLSAAMQQRGSLALGDLGEAARVGDPLATELIGTNAHAVAEVAANLVNFMNPGVLVIGGGVLRAGVQVVDEIESVVRARATDLVARDLAVRAATLDHLEGLQGAALLAVENLFSPSTLPRWIAQGTPVGHAVMLQRYGRAFA